MATRSAGKTVCHDSPDDGFGSLVIFMTQDVAYCHFCNRSITSFLLIDPF